jgi:large subunit ribosomal protein L3
MSKFGLFAMKKEMTKLWVDGAHVSVTLLQIPEQEVVRYKTEEKDGYSALVLGVDKKESDAKKGAKISYATMAEFSVDQDFVDNNPV